MTCTKSLLCPECWEEVDATYEIRHHVEQVRGVTVEADIEHYVCPKCGESIGWAPIVDKGLHKLYHAYQEKMGLMLPEEIVALRKKYGFSQRVLAAILDIGVASLQRYERGCLASDSHAQLLANARDPRFLLKCLERGARKLSDEERAKACDTVRKRGLFRVDYAVVRLNVLDEIAKEKTLDTGMRAFDSDRMRETVVYLARHVHDLYRTKLNKVLFYLDFAAYRDGGEGFTGLRYAKAPFGPVPDQFELLVAGRRRRGARIARTGRRPGDRCGTRGGSHLFFCIRPEPARRGMLVRQRLRFNVGVIRVLPWRARLARDGGGGHHLVRVRRAPSLGFVIGLAR